MFSRDFTQILFHSHFYDSDCFCMIQIQPLSFNFDLPWRVKRI